MTSKRILVAASPGIASQKWLERRLIESIPHDASIQEFGKNQHLSGALYSAGFKAATWNGNGNIRKTDIKNQLKDTDYLLLFWDGKVFTDLLFEARFRNIPTKVHTFLVTEIVNKDNGSDFDAYIGRGTPWGNPYHVGTQEGQFERDEAIERYKEHFEKNILGDDSKHRGLFGLRGMRLACHCKPFACHGDVIAGYLNSLDPDDPGPV